jgi:hypothetical protein
MKMLKNLLITLCLLLVSVNVFASKARSRMMVDRIKEDIRSGRRTSTRDLDVAQKNFELEVGRKLRGTRYGNFQMNISHVRKYIERYAATPAETEAVYDLIRSFTARGGEVIPAKQKATAEMLGVAMKLNEKGEFVLTPRDILEIDRHWTVGERQVLTDVMVEASSIIENNPGKTVTQAFEEALANRGMLEQFKKRCGK